MSNGDVERAFCRVLSKMAEKEHKSNEQRKEGWGSLANARSAHYFNVDGYSLCGKWYALGRPIWEINQELGCSPTKGTCKACWYYAKKRQGIKP